MAARLLCLSLLVVSLAGCLGGDDAQVAPAAVEPLTFGDVPETVVVFNTTLDGSVEFVFVLKDGCDAEGAGESLSLYDRSGLVQRVPYTAASGVDESRVTVPVEGEAPFALAGAAMRCLDAEATVLEGVVDGFQPRSLQFMVDESGATSYQWVADSVVTVDLAAGAAMAEAEWVPDEFTWGLYNIRSTDEGRSGVGVTRQIVYDAEGRTPFFLGCAQLVLDPCRDSAGPFFFTPAGYRFVVESDLPSAGLSRSVVFSHHTFGSDVCALGFQWSICPS